MARIDEALAKKGLQEQGPQSFSELSDQDAGPVLRGVFQQDAVENTWGWVTTEELGPQRPVLVLRDESVPWPTSRDIVRVQLRDPDRSGRITAQLLSDAAPTTAKRHLSGVLQMDKKGNHWIVSRDPISSRSLYVFVAPNDLDGAHPQDHVRVELHTRVDSKLSGRVIARDPATDQAQPRFYQGELQQDKSGNYWVTSATPVTPGPLRTELTLTRPVFIADKDVAEVRAGSRVIIELHARHDDKLSARVVSIVPSKADHVTDDHASGEFESVLTIDSHSGMGYAVHPVTRAVHVMPTRYDPCR